MDIILASSSPRRKELIKILYPQFISIDPNVDETVSDDIEPEDRPVHLAVAKAMAVAKDYPDKLVIGCDTTVFLDHHILNKPVDSADAHRMLRLLSGRTHEVITGCCVCYMGKHISFSEKTKVRFFDLTDQEIEQYVLTNEPFDKAGAYAIQGHGALIVKGIEGDYYNVMGLPLARLNKVIYTFLNS